jgi:hypothetical protein
MARHEGPTTFFDFANEAAGIMRTTALRFPGRHLLLPVNAKSYETILSTDLQTVVYNEYRLCKSVCFFCECTWLSKHACSDHLRHAPCNSLPGINGEVGSMVVLLDVQRRGRGTCRDMLGASRS